MADRTAKTTLFLAALLAVAPAFGCGPLHTSGETQAARIYDIPGLFKTPSALSPVAVGSRDVVSLPAPGSVTGPIALRLVSEPGATIHYGFNPDFQGGAATYPYEYKEPVLIVPPVTVWVQAAKDGTTGPTRSFSFDEDPSALPPIDMLSALRLQPGDDVAVTTLTEPLPTLPASGLAERLATPPTVDGKDDDWPRATLGRLAILDARGDVPAPYSASDLVEIAAGETDDSFYVMLKTASKPRTYERLAYGIEIGASNVKVSNFGAGATYTYRWEVAGGTLRLWQKDAASDEKVELQRSPMSAAVVGDVVELRVAKADAPLLAGLTDLSARAYAFERVDNGFVQDRCEPIFLRSSFAMQSYRFGDDERPTEMQFMTAPKVMTEKFAQNYLALGELFVKDLERANGIRLVGRGTLPLFFTTKEERGYAGLNTSDRGMLTTIGPNAAPLSQAQILAHELAHYQNARSSKLDTRWLQEGMSEWSAERLLYQHFPARAVHRFLRSLRFDNYFSALESAGGKDTFLLDAWGQDAAPLGYQKSLMFLTLLEARVGQPALIKAFQRAQSEPLTSMSFMALLEMEAGESLQDMVPFWLKGNGAVATAASPELFYDDDNDGLLNIDEQVVGTDPLNPDSDGDGYSDAEEQFGGQNPLQAAVTVTSAPVLAGATTKQTSPLLRFAAPAGERVSYALDRYNPDLAYVYSGPIPLRPPFSVVAKIAGQDETHVLSRGLFINGQSVAITYPTDNMLPPTPRTTHDLRTDVTVVRNAGSGTALTDAAGDMPDELAAYDLVSARLVTTADSVTITLKTRGEPDRFGSYGDYLVTFDNPSFTANGPLPKKAAAFKLSGGAPYWQDFRSADTSMKAMASGVEVTYAPKTLTIRLSQALLSHWAASSAEKWACPSTDVLLDHGQEVKDTIGCVITTTSEHVARTGTAPDHFGVGNHTIQMFMQANEYTQQRANDLLDLGLTALSEFERVLGRPWLARSDWPVHVYYTTSGTLGTASSRTGALIAAPAATEGDVFDYLFVEQLARLAVVDALTADAPYWVQEAFVQWLTASALYRVLPSTAVHAFNHRRLAEYRCYLSGAMMCQSYFDDEVPLAGWNSSTLSTTGSVKSLLAVLYLDSILGADVMGQAFGMFANSVPSTALMQLRLQGLAPAQTAAIEAFFEQWVVGTGDDASDKTAVQATLVDGDGDLLFKFEEDKLGTSDAVADPYLD